MTLALSEDLRAKILAAAARVYPNECCGLIEGAHDKDGWRALAVHETRNLAEDVRAHFLIDPEAHFCLLRSLRGTQREIIGCYHSHPDGRAEPSATDLSNAIDENFLWLIANAKSVRAFVFESGSFREVAIA